MLESGSVLQNRYQLKQKLSDNPVRQTWLAEDWESHDQVAVKLLAFGGQMQWDDLKLFEREAQVLKLLSHPQIPKYRDYFAVDEGILSFCLVQEYIPGSSLKQLLERGQQFSEEQVRKIAQDVLEILIYLHALTPPVLHRDIKPGNLIVGADEKVYLVDFGAVQNRASAGVSFTVVGTYGYAPVEQYGGMSVPASDLYALGATLIHLLTGTPPFDLPQRDLRIQFRDRVRQDVSLYFVRWIERLTQPALERRFSSAVEARDAIAGRLSVEPAIADIDAPTGTRVIVSKSPERLEIQIPARVEVEAIEPVKNALNRGTERLKGGLNALGGKLKGSSEALAKRTVLWRAGALGGALVLLGAGLPTIVYAVRILILLVEAGLFMALCLLVGNWLARRRSYFERTYVYFDRESFGIELQQVWLLNYRRQKGVTDEIQDVSVAPYYDSTNLRNFPPQLGVVIVTGNFERGLEKYAFGQELSEAELVWLANEIRDWLGSRLR